jgi:hypothetical protein
MALTLIVKDGFPLLFVAHWASRAEAHETITTACRSEAMKSGLSRLESATALPANHNERSTALARRRRRLGALAS